MHFNIEKDKFEKALMHQCGIRKIEVNEHFLSYYSEIVLELVHEAVDFLVQNKYEENDETLRSALLIVSDALLELGTTSSLDEEKLQLYFLKHIRGKPIDFYNFDNKQFSEQFAGAFLMLIPETACLLVEDGLEDTDEAINAITLAKSFSMAELEKGSR